jgi:cell division protein FtsN
MFLQLGAFTNEKNAQALAHRVRTIVGHDHRVTVLCKANIYKLQLGPLTTLEAGEKLKELLKTKGFNDVIFIR